MKILVLASYCGPDDPQCTDDLPCPACLKMCNVGEIVDPVDVKVHGGWDYLRRKKRRRVIRDEPMRRRRRRMNR